MKITSRQLKIDDARLRTIIIAGSALLLLLAIGAGALLLGASGSKTAVGEIKLADGGSLVVSRYDDVDLRISLSNATTIRRDENSASAGALQPGDSVRVEYESGWWREDTAVEILAKSPFMKGRLIDIDVSAREIVIKGFTVRLFKVTEQTVILRDGSLLKLKSLERGLEVRAEFSNTDRPKLDRLTVTE